MAINIDPVIIEMSAIVPALNRHFIYNHTDLDVEVKPNENWEISGYSIHVKENRVRVRLSLGDDQLDVAIFRNGEFFDGFDLSSKDGNDRANNLKRLIDILIVKSPEVEPIE